MQQRNEKLRLEEVVFKVDAVDEPIILEYFEEEVAGGVEPIGFTAEPQDSLTGAIIDEKPAVLLSYVPSQFNAAHG